MAYYTDARYRANYYKGNKALTTTEYSSMRRKQMSDDYSEKLKTLTGIDRDKASDEYTQQLRAFKNLSDKELLSQKTQYNRENKLGKFAPKPLGL